MCNFSVILFNNYKQTLFFFSFFSLYSQLNYYFCFRFGFNRKFPTGGRSLHTHLNSFAHTLIVFVLRSSSCRVCVCVWCMCMWVYEFLTLCVCVCVCVTPPSKHAVWSCYGNQLRLRHVYCLLFQGKRC